MVKELIDYNTSVRLRLAVDKLANLGIAGIKNQIYHLGAPDDNEIYEYVFEYLENEINQKISGWADLKVELQRIKKDNKI